MVGIVVEPPLCVAFNATDCGRIGLHGECELTDALDDVSGTPDVEYKSWLNCNKYIRKKNTQRRYIGTAERNEKKKMRRKKMRKFKNKLKSLNQKRKEFYSLCKEMHHKMKNKEQKNINK